MPGILRIALLSITIGVASIPVSFAINSSPVIVWLGNALGSLLSALVVIFIANRISDTKFKQRVSKRFLGRKVITVFEEGDNNKKVLKARIFVDNHGLKIFSFIAPIFPGVLIATAAVYIFELNREIYKRWVIAGIFFASGAYVFGYWWVFVR